MKTASMLTRGLSGVTQMSTQIRTDRCAVPSNRRNRCIDQDVDRRHDGDHRTYS
jgi:hypothetical protein